MASSQRGDTGGSPVSVLRESPAPQRSQSHHDATAEVGAAPTTADRDNVPAHNGGLVITVEGDPPPHGEISDGSRNAIGAGPGGPASTASCLEFVTDAALQDLRSPSVSSSQHSHSHNGINAPRSEAPKTLLEASPLEEHGLRPTQITIEAATPPPTSRGIVGSDPTSPSSAKLTASDMPQPTQDGENKNILGLLGTTAMYASPTSHSPISRASAMIDDASGAPSTPPSRLFSQNRRRRASVSSTPDIEKALHFDVDVTALPYTGIPGLDEAPPPIPTGIPNIAQVRPAEPAIRTPASIPAQLRDPRGKEKDIPTSQAPVHEASKTQASPPQPGQIAFANAILLNLYLIMEDPSSSTFALIVNCAIVLNISLGTAVATAGTVDVVMNNEATRM